MVLLCLYLGSKLLNIVGMSGTIHRPVLVHLLPFRISLSLYCMSTPMSPIVDLMSHFLLPSLTLEISEYSRLDGLCTYPFFLGSAECPRILNVYILPFLLRPLRHWLTLVLLFDFGASFLVSCASVCRKKLLVLKSNIMQYHMFVRFVSTNPVVSTH